MRFVTVIISVVLLLIALLGIGAGVYGLMKAASMGGTNSERGMGVIWAVLLGGIPFIAGTVALAGLGAIFSVEQVRTELEIARADRETLAAQEIARRRNERRSTPEFKAQVEAVKAEQRTGGGDS